MYRTRNAACPRGYRGFESHPLRHLFLISPDVSDRTSIACDTRFVDAIVAQRDAISIAHGAFVAQVLSTDRGLAVMVHGAVRVRFDTAIALYGGRRARGHAFDPSTGSEVRKSRVMSQARGVDL